MKLLTTPDIGMPGKSGVFEIEFDFNDIDTAGQALGLTIPANSLVKMRLSRLTAFDSGVSDVLNVGKLGALTEFISASDLHGTGLGAEAAFHVTAETALLYGITKAGADATHGQAKLLVEVTRLSA